MAFFSNTMPAMKIKGRPGKKQKTMNDIFKTAAFQRGFKQAAAEEGLTEGEALDLMKRAAGGLLEEMAWAGGGKNLINVANRVGQASVNGATAGGGLGGSIGGGLGGLAGAGIGGGLGHLLGVEDDPVSGRKGNKGRLAALGSMLGGGLGGVAGGAIGGAQGANYSGSEALNSDILGLLLSFGKTRGDLFAK